MDNDNAIYLIILNNPIHIVQYILYFVHIKYKSQDSERKEG